MDRKTKVSIGLVLLAVGIMALVIGSVNDWPTSGTTADSVYSFLSGAVAGLGLGLAMGGMSGKKE